MDCTREGDNFTALFSFLRPATGSLYWLGFMRKNIFTLGSQLDGHQARVSAAIRTQVTIPLSPCRSATKLGNEGKDQHSLSMFLPHEGVLGDHETSMILLQRMPQHKLPALSLDGAANMLLLGGTSR